MHHTLNSLQRLQNLERPTPPSDAERPLASDIHGVFTELKYWEQKCLDEGSLNQSRYTMETIWLRKEPYGLEEQHTFLMPSPNWHERLASGEFEILRKGREVGFGVESSPGSVYMVNILEKFQVYVPDSQLDLGKPIGKGML